ncbi:MAG TPA: HAD-IA family hydrolase [Gaiellaceae bacterium]|jgi:putative hydrolase of the HAD superfamily|nr:HAD-IA family hydrolase [Gaiellaceae bacterium]
MTALCIWDFDGTLAQRRGETGWSRLLAEVLDAEEPGHPHTAETFRPHLRNGFPWHAPDVPHPELCAPGAWWDAVRPLLSRAYEAAGYTPARARELALNAQRLYVDPSVGWRLFDDVLPVLGRLREEGWTHAILSNHVPELRTIVSALGLDELVATVVCSAEIGYEKPHPQAFAALLDSVEADRIVMIGDNVVADVLGAEAVGIPAVLVRRPDPRAARFAPDLYDVENVLDEAVAA